MATLSHRLAGAALVFAGTLGASVAWTSVASAAPAGSASSVISPAEVQTFVGFSNNLGTAFNIAFGQAAAQGYTRDQCTSRILGPTAGFFEVDLTCRR